MEKESWKDFGYWQLPPNCIRVTGQSTHELTYEGMAVNIQDIIRADRAALHKEILEVVDYEIEKAKRFSVEAHKLYPNSYGAGDAYGTWQAWVEARKAIDEVFSSKE